MTDATPTVLGGRYEVGRRLGGSDVADVYAGRDLQLGRPVALKVLRPEALADPAAIERLRRGASAAASISDEHVVPVYDWSADANGAYVAMELVDGAGLDEALRTQGPLPAARAVELAAGVAGGLAAAHRAGVVHGGLEPRDVLISRDGRARVTDFAGGPAGLPVGSPEVARRMAAYAAPEQLQGGVPDARSDQYALGAVLYESLTGATPFTGADAVDLANRALHEQPVPPSQRTAGVPFTVDAVVLRLLARDPAARFASADEAQRELLRVHDAISAPPTVAAPAAAPLPATAAMPAPAAVAVAEPEKSGRGWLIGLVVILALALVGALLFALLRNDGSSKDKVTVPAVVGQREQEAAQALENAGLSVSPVKEANDQFAEGLVFAQSPAAGKQAAKDSVVVIKVSTGPTPTTTTTRVPATTTSSSTTTSTTSSTTTTTAPAPSSTSAP